jgi:hypothetical protein
MKVFVFIDILARILGIGPRTGVLETLILPLNYIRMFIYLIMITNIGFFVNTAGFWSIRHLEP